MSVFSSALGGPLNPEKVGGKMEEARRSLRKRPVLVLFFMDGCPHCVHNEPAWKAACKKVKGKMKIVRIESKDVPPEEGVSSFPTMKYRPAHGPDRVLPGSQTTGADILMKLGLKGDRGTRRRKADTRKTRRRV
jgi:thiol-disulfide isomerase/thioredoxin